MWVAMFIFDSCTGLAFLVSRDCKRNIWDMEFEIEARLADIGQLPPEHWYLHQDDDMTWTMYAEVGTEYQHFAQFRALGV